MKAYSIITGCLFFSLTACQNSDQVSEVADPTPAPKKSIKQRDEVKNAVARAIADQDYRLLSTSTRMPQFPGTDQSRYQEYKTKCGANFLAKMGDVKLQAGSSDRRKQRKQYMAEYNQLILKRCLNNKSSK